MQSKIFLLLLLTGSSLLVATPAREGVALQEFRISLQQYSYDLHSHKTEIDILHEKLQNLESSITSFKRELGQKGQSSSLESRVASLEKNHQTVVGDLKQLKSHINDASSKLVSLEKQLKGSLNSVVSLLQPGGGEDHYTVQDGDSLGQIALNHKISIKRLKELNELQNDRIFVGQKLRFSE
ncbi:MAG: D-gamma-glutamyl-meso-diaminopimelic acid endopeptidase CwlS [Chlamydiae bacterium]|nr:D-gamma-glutamyl-meso-diaminopimelic acid endopeptidase CwlS [Chlamydiota bacterium]